MSQSVMMTQQQQQVHQESSVARGGSQGGLLFSDEEMDSGMSSGTTATRRTRRRVARSQQQDIMSGGEDGGVDSDYAAPSPRYGRSSKGRGSGESTPVRSPLSRLSPDVGGADGAGSGVAAGPPKEGGWRHNFPLSLDEDLPKMSSVSEIGASGPSAAAKSSSVERKELTPTRGEAAKPAPNAGSA